MKKQPLLNTHVNNADLIDAINEILSFVEQKKKSYVVFVNADVIVQIERDEYLKRIADNADLVFVDGQPVVWLSMLLKRPVKAKVSGSDLVPELCKAAAQNDCGIFFIGGKEGIAEKARENLEREIPGIRIVGTYSPPFGFEKDQQELDKINTMISDVHPDLVIACFGCPKQEKWIFENYLKYDGTVSICAGATIDFLAGNVNRAPVWMRTHGLEWAYRLFQEPGRLFKRYLIDDMKILKIAWKYRK